MNKQIIVIFALFALVVSCVLANEYGYQQHYEKEEKKFIQLPALKLRLNMDKLTFKLPNLGMLFRTHTEEHHYPQHY